MGLRIKPDDVASMTGGLVAQQNFSVLPNVPAFVTGVVTVTFMIVSNYFQVETKQIMLFFSEFFVLGIISTFISLLQTVETSLILLRAFVRTIFSGPISTPIIRTSEKKRLHVFFIRTKYNYKNIRLKKLKS